MRAFPVNAMVKLRYFRIASFGGEFVIRVAVFQSYRFGFGLDRGSTDSL